MKLFVTGAAGFLGSAVVRAARRRGDEVVALCRRLPEGLDGDGNDTGVTWIAGDVREPAPWEHALGGCAAVAHLAASSAEPAEQWDVAVRGTGQLLAAMAGAGVDRLVLVSSFAVYDYLSVEPGEVVDEGTRIETRPERRDPYTRSKLAQERLVGDRPDLRTTIIRPGLVYGPGHLWDGGLARPLPGPLAFAVARRGRMKLTQVDNCAEAIVLAAERDGAVGTVLNVVDDELPSQAELAASLARHGWSVPRSLPLPYGIATALARFADTVNRRLLHGRLPLPELLVPARLAARYKPLAYTNESAKRLLDWAPRRTLDEALGEALGGLHD